MEGYKEESRISCITLSKGFSKKTKRPVLIKKHEYGPEENDIDANISANLNEAIAQAKAQKSLSASILDIQFSHTPGNLYTVCHILEPPPPPPGPLVHVERNNVSIFDILSKAWEPHMAFNPPIEVDIYTQWVWVRTGLFCSGGMCYLGLKRGNSKQEAYILMREMEWSPCQYPHMTRSRYYHGLWWSAGKNLVFVFGGQGAQSGRVNSLKACENLNLNSRVWSELPTTMTVPRWCFNPCEYHSAVYLCGGYTKHIEIFDQESKTFTLLQAQLIDQLSATVTFIWRDQLVVLSSNHMTFFVAGQSQQLEEWRRQEHMNLAMAMISNMSPLLDEGNGLLYVCSKGDCHIIDLEDFSRKRITH